MLCPDLVWVPRYEITSYQAQFVTSCICLLSIATDKKQEFIYEVSLLDLISPLSPYKSNAQKPPDHKF